jgi:CRP-like cAMP-binding protein
VIAREPTVTFEVRKDTMARIFEQNAALVERVALMIAERQKANESALLKPGDVVEQRAEARSILYRIRDFFRLHSGADPA